MDAYTVSWTVITADCDSAGEAALQAWGMMDDALRSAPDGATILRVSDDDNNIRWYAMQESGVEPLLIKESLV